jgi:ferric-dicitrate binding protein FerR (iron transport regulator)
MNGLIDKYRKDELTPAELSELKRRAGSMTDEEIERQIYAGWLNSDMGEASVDGGSIHRLKVNIDAAIGESESARTRHALFPRWLQMAAAVLLPLFILLTGYLYRENSRVLSDEMVVFTQRGERANVTLPDGTVVSLNADSKLAYRPKSYNKSKRRISFNGEGYFQVFKDAGIPFLIDAKGLRVEVLGTAFNLHVRENDNTAELALEEGSVSLLSTRSRQNVVLLKNQKAILNQLTGCITVIDDENTRDRSAWKRGDMVFRNTELSQVIRRIEENYGITIKMNCKDCLSDPFTGTLPVNNLNEVLEVIERSYHLQAVIGGREIVIKRK